MGAAFQGVMDTGLGNSWGSRLCIERNLEGPENIASAGRGCTLPLSCLS